MPNWCNNSIIIEGPSPKLDEFMKVIGGDYKLENFHLPPENADINWCIDNWGCKWTPTVESILETETYIILKAETPWGPPIELLLKVSKELPELVITLYYNEPGLDINGKCIIAKGRCLLEEYKILITRNGVVIDTFYVETNDFDKMILEIKKTDREYDYIIIMQNDKFIMEIENEK